MVLLHMQKEWSEQEINNGQSTQDSALACAEALWSDQGILNGWSTQERCSCMYRSAVVRAGDNKWLEHTEMVLLNMQRHCGWSMAH